MIYLDSAAVVKLVHPEAETPALNLWLAERVETYLVSSVLAEVEVHQAIRRCAALTPYISPPRSGSAPSSMPL